MGLSNAPFSLRGLPSNALTKPACRASMVTIDSAAATYFLSLIAGIAIRNAATPVFSRVPDIAMKSL